MAKFCGKPKDREDAIRMLRKLQGRRHSVFTSLSVIIEERGKLKEYKETYETYVFVKKMEDSEILNYVDTYDVLDKAGSYAIQSKFAVYVEKIEGDYNAIIGLPVSRLYDIFKENEIW
ncbi:MAG: Maf family protein [Clostridia bacterium]|nr:Maf family protein [Clostridia bacterium]